MNEFETKTLELLSDINKDESLRKELIADPKAVFQRELGVEYDPGREIKVLEETKDVGYIVLPYVPPSDHLSQEELDMVSGGGYNFRISGAGADSMARISRMRSNIKKNVPVNSATTDSSLCYTVLGGGGTYWGCDD